VQIDTWYHLAVVKDGSAAKIYINGEEIAVGSAGSIVNNEHPLLLGRNEGTFYYQLNGTLDEVRFWNYARSEAEINAFMNDVLDGDETGLSAYYRFDQNEGDLLVDRTGNQNHGTLQNMDNSNWIPADWLTILEAPQNIQISIAEGIITLSWSGVNGATSYQIYSSETPDGEFTEETEGSFGETSWSAVASDSKKFYQVRAIANNK